MSLKQKRLLTAGEILQCHCQAGESLTADCSKATVQRLQSMGHNTCRCRPIVASDGWRERRANSHRQDTLPLHHEAPCSQLEVDSLCATAISQIKICRYETLKHGYMTLHFNL